MTWYGAVDLGATHLRAAVGTENGTFVSTSRVETPQGPSGTAVTDAVLDSLQSACSDAGCDPRSIAAVGIGSMGPLDATEGAVDDPPNVPSVERIDLVDPVSELTGTERVTLHNDAVAGVIGERFYGDDTPDNAVYLTMSTGIGAGVMADGTVLDGWKGNAAEVGHLVVDSDGVMTCGCGIDGHWEGYCSGRNLPRYARRVRERTGLATDLSVDDPEFEASDVFGGAGEDALADRVLADFVEFTLRGVADLVHAFAPEAVYVGGAVARNNPEFVLGPLREQLGEHVVIEPPRVEEPTRGSAAVLSGALASVLPDG